MVLASCAPPGPLNQLEGLSIADRSGVANSRVLRTSHLTGHTMWDQSDPETGGMALRVRTTLLMGVSCGDIVETNAQLRVYEQ